MIVVSAGCGLATYEERLEETNNYFAYLNKLKAHLDDKTWVADGDFGINMRVPRGFARLPGPKLPDEGEEGADAAVAEGSVFDPRQPDYLGISDMPGLIDAWSVSLNTTGGSAGAYLYVMGNHQRFLVRAANDGGGPDPAEFLTDLDLRLQSEFGVTLPEGESDSTAQDNVRYFETIPRIEKYSVPKDFTAVSFLPSADSAAGGLNLKAQLFTHRAGAVQVAVLLVYPAAVQVDPVESFTLALETLSVSDEPPRLRRSGDTPTGGPSGF